MPRKPFRARNADEYPGRATELVRYAKRKEEIDKRIETLLNLRQSPKDIVEVLIEEFGAFPNKSIIKTYSAKPGPNYLPEYALAVAIQQVVRVDRS